jgi:predicted RNase H-like HicB family nuclease
MRKPRNRQFTVLIERDSAGWFVASVPEFPGCHTQARSLDKLIERIREAIALCIEVERGSPSSSEFIGIQRIAI